MKTMITVLIALTVLGCSFISTATVKETGSIDFKKKAKIIKNPCLDQDVWAFLKHTDKFDPTCTVVVFIPKASLEGDLNNCPAGDTTVIGEGRAGINLSKYVGIHVLILKKGFLNSPKNYTTTPPKSIEYPADNINIWRVKL